MLGQIGSGHATDQELGDLARFQPLDEGAYLALQAETDAVGGDLAVEDPLQGLGILHRLLEQVMHLDHFDAAFAHLGHEVEVVALGLGDPDHVIEQQFVAVVGGQAQMGQTRRTDHHLVQFAGFGMNA